MKKIICVITLLVLVFSLASCESNPIFATLTSLANKPSAMVKLDITTSIDGEKLNSSYTITELYVNYKIESLSSITLGENGDFIVTKSGKAIIENGEIKSINGENLSGIPEYSTLVGKFTFKENNFANILVDTNSFSADIIDLSKFLGTETDGKAGKVSIEFSEKRINKITLSYTENGAFVSAIYEFS